MLSTIQVSPAGRLLESLIVLSVGLLVGLLVVGMLRVMVGPSIRDERSLSAA